MRSFLTLCLAFQLCVVVSAQAQGSAGVPKLPFKVRPDGSVDPRELLKLTKQPTATDRISDEDLEAIKKAHEIDYGKGFTPTAKPQLPPRGDLYDSSALLTDGENHTLLPKHALMWVPDSLKERVITQRVGRLILWPDFLKANTGWLQAKEIGFDMAAGKIPFEYEAWRGVVSAGKVTISVMGGHPISMLQPRPTLLADGTLDLPKTEPAAKQVAHPAAVPALAAAKAPDKAAIVVDTPKTTEVLDTAKPAPATSAKPAPRFDTGNRFEFRKRQP